MMSSSSHVQLVKWSFPAVALMIGFFWYKRRRIDRADPGGSVESGNIDKSTISDTKKATRHFYDDSGIQEMEESSSTNHCMRQEESICVPRKISESLDIPIRKSTSQSFSTQSFNSDHSWHKKVDSDHDMDTQLSSKPNTSNLEMIVNNQSMLSDMDNNDSKNIVRISKDLAEGEECMSQCQIESFDQKNEIDECNHNEKNETKENSENGRQTLCERDSANHSPISGVLEGSIIDEARSEGSTDSGKGEYRGSINGRGKDNIVSVTYDFAIPQYLVGRLIGRHGSFLQNIRIKTGIDILVNQHPYSREQKICSMQGTVESITAALNLIRQKFPEKRFPQMTLVEISTPSKIIEEVTWITELMQLSLVEGVNNDVTICHIIKPNWFFIQLPTHPTYPNLRLLDANMTQSYNTTEPPPVPNVLKKGMIFVAKWNDTWVRVCVENPDPLGEKNLVRLVDHGGYWICSNSQMRKIRSDYLTLPFQAIEIFLANIQAKNGVWPREAYTVVAQICSGVVSQAQIEGYIDSHVYVNLYFNLHKYGVISLADELTARGFADLVALEDMIPESIVPIL